LGRLRLRGEAAAFVIGACFLALIGRLYRIQQINGDYYQNLAGKQHRGLEYLEPTRGMVYTSDGQVLASSLLVDSVYIDSQFVGKQAQTALTLQRALRLSPATTSEVYRRIQEGDRFIWVKRKICDKEKEILQRLNIPGVFFAREFKRYYPAESRAAQIIGFCDVDDKGLDGIELTCDSYLVGIRGFREFERDALGNKITKPGMLDVPQVDGNHLFLTIDSVIQHITEKAVEDAYTEWKPVWVTAIVMDVRNGEILAMACRPTFDPNKPGNYAADRRRNYAVTDMYEPGSTFKPITFAALFEQKLVTLDTEVFCENGTYRLGRRTLRDHTPHDLLTVLHVIAKSSNIGTAKCAELMTNSSFDGYMRDFGLSSPTGIEIPGEAEGQLRSAGKWSKYSKTSLAMGQEINVTALQMVTAFSAIANGGTLYCPSIVKRVVSSEGDILLEHTRKAVRRVIGERTTADLTRAMIEVVESGTGTKVKSDKYMIAGKTGTAQKQEPGIVGYSPGKFFASFCGFAPASNPQICVIVVVNEPHGWSHFGGTVAGPPAKEIIEQTLIYMRVPGDRKKEDASADSDGNGLHGASTAQR
jgi:cell division protein FtsI (penicillin-binding protein 3)